MKQRQRIAAFVALLGVVLHALWPLIAQARPQSTVLVPVCTVEGVTHYLEQPGGRSPLDDSAAHHQEHCAYCFPALQPRALPVFEAQKAAQAVDSVDTQCDSKASILIMDARGPPISPLVKFARTPRREHEMGFMGRDRGLMAAVASGGFMRIGVLLG